MSAIIIPYDEEFHKRREERLCKPVLQKHWPHDEIAFPRGKQDSKLGWDAIAVHARKTISMRVLKASPKHHSKRVKFLTITVRRIHGGGTEIDKWKKKTFDYYLFGWTWDDMTLEDWILFEREPCGDAVLAHLETEPERPNRRGAGRNVCWWKQAPISIVIERGAVRDFYPWHPVFTSKQAESLELDFSDDKSQAAPLKAHGEEITLTDDQRWDAFNRRLGAHPLADAVVSCTGFTNLMVKIDIPYERRALATPKNCEEIEFSLRRYKTRHISLLVTAGIYQLYPQWDPVRDEDNLKNRGVSR